MRMMRREGMKDTGVPLTSRAIWLSASSSAVRRSRFGSRFLPAPCVPMAGWGGWDPEGIGSEGIEGGIGSGRIGWEPPRAPPTPASAARPPQQPDTQRPRPAHAPPAPAGRGLGRGVLGSGFWGFGVRGLGFCGLGFWGEGSGGFHVRRVGCGVRDLRF